MFSPGYPWNIPHQGLYHLAAPLPALGGEVQGLSSQNFVVLCGHAKRGRNLVTYRIQS